MSYVQYGQNNVGSTQGTQTAKVPNPLWYRGNDAYLAGVSSAGSNPSFGIQNIRLNESSPAQKQYGIMVNGLLSTVIGTLSFQIRNSPRTGAPFVQTISEKIEKAGEEVRYWEHVMLSPQVKAQILRHYEEVTGAGTNGAVQPQTQVAPPVPPATTGVSTSTPPANVDTETGEVLDTEIPI